MPLLPTPSSHPTQQQSKKLSLSIVVPVYNGGDKFRQCLASLRQFAPPESEIIVVADGDTDGSGDFAAASDLRVVRIPTSGGPAKARNLGAQAASGDILFFVDADVTIAAGTVEQVLRCFEREPDLAALIGSYDDAPAESNFLSQYKNLFHHYTHQTGNEMASTFWGACGAIRREIFLKMEGFDASYRHPCIEDIELGYRLKAAGYKIRLCKSLQVKHLKRWGIISLVKTDFFLRALPWMALIYRDRQAIGDLNLNWSNRASVVLLYGLLAALALTWFWLPAAAIAGLCAAGLLAINAPVYRFFARQRGWLFAIAAIPWHWFYYFYSGLAFAIGTVRYWYK